MEKWEIAMTQLANILHDCAYFSGESSREIIEKITDYKSGITEANSCAVFPTKKPGWFRLQVSSTRYGTQEFLGPELRSLWESRWNKSSWNLPDLDQEILPNSFEDLQTVGQMDTAIELEEEIEPEQTLQVLHSSASSLLDRRQAIFDVEACNFTPEQEHKLLPSLARTYLWLPHTCT